MDESQVFIGNDRGRALSVSTERGLLQWNVSVDHEHLVFMTPVYDPSSQLVIIGGCRRSGEVDGPGQARAAGWWWP